VRLAAIDVGTNTTRLIIIEPVSGGYRDLERRLIFTRLGEGVDSERRLRPSAVQRTVAAIAEYCALCGELGVSRIRVAGTSALRDAKNSEDFVEAAGKLAGTRPEVLTGEEEARLALLGATHGMESGLYLVCDIGGGSTEFVLGRTHDTASEISQAISLEIGAVRLTERFLASDPPAAEEMILMEGAIGDALGEAVRKIGDVSSARLIGVAGTITTMAALHLGLESYDPERTNHLRMERGHVDGLYKMLASFDYDRRRAIPSMPEGRADVIVAGAAILARAMHAFELTEVTVSERDILDGLVIDMMKGIEE
jgi:exopolyphosphatase/guanosine-5'-triphosphate,3'-diphosphate pyrophosphatase